jgi:hypothetical protein
MSSVPLSRRTFLQRSCAALAAAQLSVERSAHAAGSDELKLALVGCGGRGTGAANQNLNVGKGARLIAMADISRDRLDKSLQMLKQQHPDQVDVSMANQFIGFDACQEAIALADLVQTVKRLHEGAVGDITSMTCAWLGSARAGLPREAGEGELQSQLRNWYYFAWISGDFIVDSHSWTRSATTSRITNSHTRP